MKRPLRHRFAIGFFSIYLLAVIWPVARWVAEPLPLILGLPLPLAWSILWIVLSFLVLLWLEWYEDRP